MNIQAIQAKAAKGEQLTDEELKFFGTGWSLDDAISKARKDATEKATSDLATKLAASDLRADEAEAALEAKSTTGKTETEKLKLQLEKATKKVADNQKQIEEQAAAVAKATRDGQIDAIAGGIQWVNPNAGKAGRVLLERELVGITDLSAEAEVTPILDAAKATSLTLLMAAESTTGAGVHSSTGKAAASSGKEPIHFSYDMFKGKTSEERENIIRTMERQNDPEMEKTVVGSRTVMRATANIAP